MLGYVFWHRPAAGPAVEYEAALTEFHRQLAVAGVPGLVSSASFAVDALPWQQAASGPAYEDWYVVEDYTALGHLNAAAVRPPLQPAHDRVAAGAGFGAGALYALEDGPPDQDLAGQWFAKPAGMGYPELRACLAGAVTGTHGRWRRQLVFGPAPEFLLSGPSALSLPALDAVMVSRQRIR